MGPGSIELVMDIEIIFGIQNPDAEAETIYTLFTKFDGSFDTPCR